MPRSYENSVFVNCPFDPTYRPLFEAVAFSIYDCGFYPRCALEVEDGTEVRIQKINGIMSECRLAVHDISHTEPDPSTGLPRFNMPLELGIFLGAKSFGARRHRRKAGIILDRERYRYQQYISDIAGQDIRAHHRQPDVAICHVRDFLSVYAAPELLPPGGDHIAGRYASFRRQLPLTCEKARLKPDKLTFRDLTNLIVGWMRTHPREIRWPRGSRPTTSAPAGRQETRGIARRRPPDRESPAPRR